MLWVFGLHWLWLSTLAFNENSGYKEKPKKQASIIKKSDKKLLLEKLIIELKKKWYSDEEIQKIIKKHYKNIYDPDWIDAEKTMFDKSIWDKRGFKNKDREEKKIKEKIIKNSIEKKIEKITTKFKEMLNKKLEKIETIEKKIKFIERIETKIIRKAKEIEKIKENKPVKYKIYHKTLNTLLKEIKKVKQDLEDEFILWVEDQFLKELFK